MKPCFGFRESECFPPNGSLPPEEAGTCAVTSFADHGEGLSQQPGGNGKTQAEQDALPFVLHSMNSSFLFVIAQTGSTRGYQYTIIFRLWETFFFMSGWRCR